MTRPGTEGNWGIKYTCDIINWSWNTQELNLRNKTETKLSTRHTRPGTGGKLRQEVQNVDLTCKQPERMLIYKRDAWKEKTQRCD